MFAVPARLCAVFRLGPSQPEAAPISLYQGRIYILPTLPGLAFAGVLVIMLVASINYGISLGYAFTFLLVGAWIASALCAFRNLLRLSIRYGKAESAFLGGNVVFHLLIDNSERRRRPALRLIGHGKRGETRFDLPPGTSGEISLSLPAERRGVLPIGRTVIETRWPLGLARAWSVVVPEMEALVFPKPETNPPPPPKSFPGSRPVDWGNLRKGNEDFASLRGYQDTDSPRHLAWKVYARSGEMMTKEFSASTGDELFFDWDELPGELSEEARLSRLAAWLLRADQAGNRYALRLPGCEFASARGEAHLHRCLGALALYETAQEKRWE